MIPTTASRTISVVGRTLLVYEGVLIGSRSLTGRKLAPTISEVVWGLRPHKYGLLPPLVVAGWLLWHLLDSPHPEGNCHAQCGCDQ